MRGAQYRNRNSLPIVRSSRISRLFASRRVGVLLYEFSKWWSFVSCAVARRVWVYYPVLSAVTLNEIEKVFTVLERLGISREAVIIPLDPAVPGSVRRLPDGKFEIIVDAEVPIDEWLPVLEEQLKALR
jgi:hypothetical protein